MAVEQDQLGWVPEPPPPRPARRDAAIESALRLFDGVDEARPDVGKQPRRSWAQSHRPQLAMAASLLLVAFVGIPAALIGLRNQPSASEHAAPSAVADRHVPSAPLHEPPPGIGEPAPRSAPVVSPPVGKYQG